MPTKMLGRLWFLPRNPNDQFRLELLKSKLSGYICSRIGCLCLSNKHVEGDGQMGMWNSVCVFAKVSSDIVWIIILSPLEFAACMPQGLKAI